ncbi:hypothetical protein B0E50_17080 [Rhodanobacter sp. C01]|nr:hypothetical protein B0E50_17080 [Rhodanobacter sp. C01]
MVGLRALLHGDITDAHQLLDNEQRLADQSLDRALPKSEAMDVVPKGATDRGGILKDADNAHRWLVSQYRHGVHYIHIELEVQHEERTSIEANGETFGLIFTATRKLGHVTAQHVLATPSGNLQSILLPDMYAPGTWDDARPVLIETASGYLKAQLDSALSERWLYIDGYRVWASHSVNDSDTRWQCVIFKGNERIGMRSGIIRHIAPVDSINLAEINSAVAVGVRKFHDESSEGAAE